LILESYKIPIIIGISVGGIWFVLLLAIVINCCYYLFKTS
jgi:hypothetical protein